MEFLLAAVCIAVAVAMILSSNRRSRRAPPPPQAGEPAGTAVGQAGPDEQPAGRNGHRGSHGSKPNDGL